MAQVTLDIAGRSYAITCNDGEEEHISGLARLVDERARQAGQNGGLTEARQLLFAALMLADELSEARNGDTTASREAAHAIDRLADRLEALAETLEKTG